MNFANCKKELFGSHSQRSLLCGLLIGAGGFSEWTVAGMLVWTLLQLRIWHNKNELTQEFKFTVRDGVTLAIGILMLIYWSFPDPVIPQSLIGLTLPEIAKAISWMLFAPIYLHTNMVNSGTKLMLGIAIGLALYSTATLVGSLLNQPFQGGYGNIYNIFSGGLDACSTEPGYVACGVLLILFRLNKRWLGFAIAITLGYAIHAQNRTALLILASVIMSCIYMNRAWFVNKFSKIKVLIVIGIISLLSVLASVSSFSIFKRFGDIFTSGRAETYSEGVNKLYLAYINLDPNILSQVETRITVNDKWWHNLALDSLRSGGFLGHILSLAWLIVLLLAALHWYQLRDLDGLLIALISISLLSTSIPLGVSSYELISILSLTLLSLNYSPIVKSQQTS